jgi:hypothetical protein
MEPADELTNFQEVTHSFLRSSRAVAELEGSEHALRLDELFDIRRRQHRMLSL